MALKDVKGIGPRAISLLAKLNIKTVDDLVTHYPFRYEYLVRGDLTKTSDNEHIIIDGRVESVPILVRFKAGLNKMNFRLVTNSGVVGVSIFNRAFLKNQLTVGSVVTVIGKFDKSKNVITASDIKLEALSNKVKIEAIYHLTNGLTNKNISTYINMAMLQIGKNVVDYIPDFNGNFIKPGHYTLALSNDREFLYLIESRELIAVIPVFKIAENKRELKKYYKSKKELTKDEKQDLRRKKRKDKFQAIINAKYAKTGATPPREYEHMEASIEYIKEGGYYLIMYEKGFIRAWGAIKMQNE